MIIDWENFTPLLSLIGGILIGFAALFMMLAQGRIMGVSGILTGLVNRQQTKNERYWRLAFMVGTFLGPVLLIIFSGVRIEIVPVAKSFQLYSAALLVGIGTAIGSGCTSGHGICGISRLSLRSLTAVAVFLITAIATVFIMRHII